MMFSHSVHAADIVSAKQLPAEMNISYVRFVQNMSSKVMSPEIKSMF